jgi:ribonucleoside-diphosphate reductase alpha chain
MNTANWIPDLFMKRVMENGEWTLFSPSDCPTCTTFGRAFEEAYVRYEAKARAAKSACSRRCRRWRCGARCCRCCSKPGHPWITFKDPCNLRSPQQHVGVVHSSNLCTEITLNTVRHRNRRVQPRFGQSGRPHEGRRPGQQGARPRKAAQRTVRTAMRMLDNVIDINYYSVGKARNSNLKHRPVGMGIMGFQDCLHELRTPYASDDAVEFADRSMEAVAYYAYWASTELAEERGRYASYKGSLWDRGILPHDSLDILAESAAATSKSTARSRWTGTRCATASQLRHAQLQLPRDRADRHHLQHHRRRSPASSRPTRTCSSNRTCRANSPWSTSTWCAT